MAIEKDRQKSGGRMDSQVGGLHTWIDARARPKPGIGAPVGLVPVGSETACQITGVCPSKCKE